jgi:glycine betaine/proline transport system permease protein
VTAVQTPPEAKPPAPATEQPAKAPPSIWRRWRRWWLITGVLVGWCVGAAIFHDDDTLEIGGAELTDFHRWLNDVRDDFDAQRETNWFFKYVIGGISDALDWTVENLQELLSQPAFPRPVPEIGWLGVVALTLLIAYALAGTRIAILATVSMLAFGYLGYWAESVDLLIVTVVAVAICAVLGR